MTSVSMSIDRAFEGKFPFAAAWSGAPGLPRAGLVWFSHWTSGMLTLMMSLARENHFLHFFLSWGHLFKNHCNGRLSEWGHLGLYETAAHNYQSWIRVCVLLEKGQTHSLGWDLSDAWYQLRLISLPHLESLLISKSSFAHFKYGGCSSRKEKGWVEVRSVKIWEASLGRSKESRKMLPAPLCPTLLQKSHPRKKQNHFFYSDSYCI